MIKVRLHIENCSDAFDDKLFIDVDMITVPRLGEQVLYTTEQYAEFEKQLNNHPRKDVRETTDIDDSHIVNFIRHDLELNIIRVSLGSM